MKYNNSSLLFALLLLLSVVSCSVLKATNNNEQYSLSPWSKEDKTPKTVVILPFDNKTQEKGLSNKVRESFYNHLSSKNFHDFELSEIDEALKVLHRSYTRPWQQLSPVHLGRFFHTDYLIYGEVSHYNKLFLGIYSQIAISVDIKMLDTKNGKVIWQKTETQRSHDGGIPFSPFGLIPAALRSGFHMKKERTADLIDRICRDIVAHVPNPPCPFPSMFPVEIQLASFLDKNRALSTMREFRLKGHKPWLEKVHIDDNLWYRVLLGPYQEMATAEKLKQTIAMDPRFKPILIHHYPLRK